MKFHSTTTLLLCAGLLAACGGSEAPAASPDKVAQPQVTDVERYFPLLADTVLAYDTESEITGEKGMLMMQVRRTRAEHAELYVAGRAKRLELVADGIRLAGGGWLLKAPLTQGMRFKGDFGEVHVTQVGKSVSTPAGTFSDCVETVEQSGNRKVTTTFCRDIGIAELVVEGQVGEEFGRERAVLRSHGPKVDIGADLPPPPPKK
ncbi:MAG: hypothetical protein R3B13_15675 [Polyangiaceae bacterium]